MFKSNQNLDKPTCNFSLTFPLHIYKPFVKVRLGSKVSSSFLPELGPPITGKLKFTNSNICHEIFGNFSNLLLKYIKKFKILIKVKFWF